MAAANGDEQNSSSPSQNLRESKMHIILDVMELDMSNKIDLALQDFLLQCHKTHPQEDSVIVFSREQLEMHKKLSIQRIQNKIDLEAYQHEERMKLLRLS